MNRNEESPLGGGDRRSSIVGRRPFLKGAGALAASAGIVGGFADVGTARTKLSVPSEPAAGASHRTYDVHAISLEIPFSPQGLYQPNGAMFVLEENEPRVRAAEAEAKRLAAAGEPQLGDDPNSRLIEPLVVRANVGDIVEITLTNELDFRCSMHNTGLPYEVETSDGMAVGYNPDTTVPPGGTITYRWHADRLGTFLFHDAATPAFASLPSGNPGNVNGFARGLWGAIVVEPEGATWTDPRTGGDLPSGTKANVHVPGGTDHREFIILYHDPEGVITRDGSPPVYPNSDTPQHIHGINYRAVATGDRFRADDPDPPSPVTFYSSWVHGDPGGGDTVFESYLGDPTKFVAVGAQVEENHVHHLHGHRWQEGARPVDGEETDTIDAQTIGPGGVYEAYLTSAYGDDSLYPDRTFEEAFEVGAGGPHRSPGDYLFHCHMFPHYGEGMNGLFRVHDKVHDDLVELPNNRANDDYLYTRDHPRPSWIDIVGTTVDNEDENEGAAEPPAPEGENGRQPNETEERWLPLSSPGAPYVDPCLEGEVKRTIEYTNVALPATVAYNDAGDHDPDARIFAIEEVTITEHRETGDEVVLHIDYSDDVQKIREGKMNPEPPVIRANVGDCIEMTLKNELPHPVSNHIHFVSYDVLGSDSTEVGFNYDQGVEPGEEYTYCWFADEEGTIFWHDHIVGIRFQMHGTFGTLVVEPEGSEWYDPYSGEPMVVGAQAMIEPPKQSGQKPFRELAVLYHDFAPLVDRDGNLVAEGVQHNVNEGVMAVNFRNSPYYHRDDADAAYVFSSARHGDPETPVLECYEDDDLVIRLAQTAYEEQHSFSVHGLRLDRRGLTDAGSQAQIIGTSEAFTFRGRAERLPTTSADGGTLDGLLGGGGRAMDNPDGLPVTDYLYGSMIDDDLWNGMWGLVRVWGKKVGHLEPLPRADAPDGTISDDQLRAMGHPAPHATFSWRKHGQRAKQYYQGPDPDTRFPSDKDDRQNGDVGRTPPKAPSPGEPCESTAPVRKYDVCALRTDIRYNDHGDHDPDGIVYALKRDVPAIESGRKNPEPLIIRANEGDCIELTLENKLDEREDEHFQVDLVTGEPEEILGEDPEDFYGQRLLQFAHGTTDDGVVRRNVLPAPDRLQDCLSYEAIAVDLENQTASVEVTVDDECETAVELSLALYLNPGAPGAFDRNAHQHLVDAETTTVGPGTHVFTVRLPGPTHPLPRAPADWTESLRMSMHAQKLRYDAQGSDGATVGFNYDQTVAPGESITYRWFADDEFGSLVLWDMADTRSHWHHGAFGKLIVEPEGSTWYDSETGKPLLYGAGASAIIAGPKRTFREFALVMSDGMDITNPSGECVVLSPEGVIEHGTPLGPDEEAHGDEGTADAAGHPDHPPCPQVGGDAEDQGFGSFNYRSEPFSRRFEVNEDQHLVYSSHVHGDPSTPVFEANLGDDVVFRTSQGGTKPRGISFHLANHYWPRYSDTENPPVVGVDDRFIPGRSIDMYLRDGAGGSTESAGDYLFREMKEFLRTESGMWGIFRVLDGDDTSGPAPLPSTVE